ncbi:uncharacterized protein F5147DRAFT_769636 [Suillus discolor]|uniref:Uncharacterized protein n=1 Tax=Suillus discolor TaxID=1912936 RepID=A0A9P7JYF4_9AGAM|nr:uncharacterized protein F5147DRAFT_769636 [Suillus discolor]KAG2115176.1 hypothetical protein F5147DRAFT_769636 [Suillus discolor]
MFLQSPKEPRTCWNRPSTGRNGNAASRLFYTFLALSRYLDHHRHHTVTVHASSRLSLTPQYCLLTLLSTRFSLVLLACTSFPAQSISFHLTSTVVSYILSLLNKTAKRCRLLTKDKMKKVLRTAITHAVDGKAWQKLANPTAGRGKMLQANAGKVPSTIKQWREANGGTHAVMADVFVKKDGTKEDVEEGLEAAINYVHVFLSLNPGFYTRLAVLSDVFLLLR